MKKQLLLNKDTLENFQAFSKNMKMSTMLNEAQVIVLIRLINEILFTMTTSHLMKEFSNEKEIIDSLIPLIKD
jgi:hypothetical protein